MRRSRLWVQLLLGMRFPKPLNPKPGVAGHLKIWRLGLSLVRMRSRFRTIPCLELPKPTFFVGSL